MYSRAHYSRTIEIRDWKTGGVDNMWNSNWFNSDLNKKSHQHTPVKMCFVEPLSCAECNTELLHYSGVVVSELHDTDPAEAAIENLT